MRNASSLSPAALCRWTVPARERDVWSKLLTAPLLIHEVFLDPDIEEMA
jgi:hypothetical protein